MRDCIAQETVIAVLVKAGQRTEPKNVGITVLKNNFGEG
jgi:hypothetical protein